MAKQQVIVLGLLLATLYGCGNRNNNENKQDEFYSVTGGWDWVRVPLLKPYEVKRVDPEIKTNPWGTKLYSDLYSADRVKRVDVQDSVIYLLCGTVDEKKDTTAIGTKNVPTAWFAIDTRTKTEKGFASEEEFNTYIKENNIDQEVLERAEIQVKYSGYIEKERNNADKLTRLEEVKIPEDFDYHKIKSMSIEAKQKLSKIKPTTIAQASRISGVSPSDISVLLIYMGR